MDKNIFTDLKPNEGKVVNINGQKVAVYKDESGKVETISAVCTHAACLVNWNSKDQTWDCPCHNSVFSKDGKVIKGPAQKPLEKINLET